MRTVILVARREGQPERDAAWAWCRARWEALHPQFPIYEGHHYDGPFNRSAATNLAARLADGDGRWDQAILVDGDVFLRPENVEAAVELAASSGKVTWAFTRWRGLSQFWSDRVIRGGPIDIAATDMDIFVQKTTPLSWSCCFVVPRSVWDEIGGYDERFEGWGWEDMAFSSTVQAKYGNERLAGDVYHLWHPRSDERLGTGQSVLEAQPEYVHNCRLGRRYMVAVKRDYDVNDRLEPVNRDALDQDVRNLTADDARLAPIARRFGLPDWDTWWPTLDELLEGAREYRVRPEPAVTLIVRSGGKPEAWPERSGYLRHSLAGLTAHVGGPIIQRVIYSDWAPEFRDELEAIAAEHGYYVAGDGHHGYTGSAQRLWRYIERRAIAPYVFLAEDDFEYLRPVELGPMIEVLEDDPRVRQVALLRAPYYERERDGAGILGWPLDDFIPREVGTDRARLEHRLLWTMNPSLFRRSITRTPWPAGPSSERQFGDAILRAPAVRFAWWGEGEPWIEHVGAVRAGHAY